MAKAISAPTALKRLHGSLVTLSDRGSDLLKRELKDAKALCMREHFRRIWEQLEPDERNAIRDEVMKDRPIKLSCHRMIDGLCVSAIEEHFGEGSGKVDTTES